MFSTFSASGLRLCVLVVLQLPLAMGVLSIAPATSRAETVYAFTTLPAVVDVTNNIAVDATGNIYFTELFANDLQKITPDGGKTVLAANLNQPFGVDVDRNGNVIIANGINRTINRVSPTGAISLIAGALGVTGSADGVGAAAQFESPSGLAADKSGNIYVADMYGHTIRKILPDGTVTTFAGTAGPFGGVTDGLGTAATFSQPADVTTDEAGNVYVVDWTGHNVRKITPAGLVTTLAGLGGIPGSADGFGGSARFNSPMGIGIDLAGNLYVADTENQTIRMITPAGQVSTIAGSVGVQGSADGVGQAATFNRPVDVAVDHEGNLYVLDSNNHRIRKGLLQTVSNVSWSTPAAMTYGSPLSATQLNATADVPGTFSYSPAAGTVPKAGLLTFAVTFTPTDSIHYTKATAQVRVEVQRAKPAITWTSPASIPFGTPLPGSRLNASANVPGTFTYSPSAGTMLEKGPHTLTATFQPDDAFNYTVATTETTLDVGEASLAGEYFGAFATGGGKWALLVNADYTGTFIAYLPNRQSAIVTAVSVGVLGSFTASGTEWKPSDVGRRGALNTGGDGRVTHASAFGLLGQITAGAVTGQLDGPGVSFSGAIDLGSGGAVEGSYSAAALNKTVGSLNAIVAPSGQTLLVVLNSDGVDAASGTLSNNHLSAVTIAGGQLDVNLGGSSHSATATFTPVSGASSTSFAGLAEGTASTARLVNITTRAYCGSANKVTIGGFAITGTAPRRVLIRAVGPTLTSFGIGGTEVLLDPTMEVHDASHGNVVIAANDNWSENANAADITTTASRIGATPLAASDQTSSALLLTLAPGAYSFVVNGKGGTSGIVLLEVYDADAVGAPSKLVNIATRADALAGNGIAAGGFVIEGNAPKRVLLRALGPSLTTFGIAAADVLSDPMIELHDAIHGNTVIASNDDWTDNGQTADVTATGSRIGATAFAAGDSKSSALLLNLAPGVYSVVARGKANGTGIVLVEVYDAD